MDKEQARQLLAERDEARAAAARLGVALARVPVCLAVARAAAEEQQPGDGRSGEPLVAAARRARDRGAPQFPALALFLNPAANAPAGDAPPRE